MNRSLHYANKEKYSKAITCNKKIIKHFASVYRKGSSQYICAVTNLGELYRIVDDFSESEKYFMEGIEITEPTSFDRAAINLQLGRLNDDLGKFKLAEKCFLEAYQKFSNHKGLPHYKYVVYDLANLYTKLGQRDLAMKYLNEYSVKS